MGDPEQEKRGMPDRVEGQHGKPAQRATADVARDAEMAASAPEQGETDNQAEGPPGGYDNTPLPQDASASYTIKITIHGAVNLPMADIKTLSSDAYVEAVLDTDLPRRHKEDALIRRRTESLRKSTDPEWNADWIVAGIPSSGFMVKFRVVDEDPTQSDDKLGNAFVHVNHIDDSWQGIQNEAFKINKRSGSKRAYFVRSCAACFDGDKSMHGDLFVSVQLLGRTEDFGQGARAYTVGPCYWIRHYSPMLGRLTNRKEPDQEDQHGGLVKSKPPQKKAPERYNFQANQMQFRGPVPKELYHRFVEFKPWVGRMFHKSGIRGHALGKALRHQHRRVYHFDRETRWGHFPEGPSREMTRQFLELVRHDEGGRIFTFVLTLDACFRFTETGPEFGVDMLSKHNMHSDKALYLAWAGEFFVRRLAHPNRPPPPAPTMQTSQSRPHDVRPQDQQDKIQDDNPTHPPSHVPDGPPDTSPPKEPENYELVIDNDSGTYRPKAALLPVLKHFLTQSLPGLHILTLDCIADAELMEKMKSEQRERKAEEGEGRVVFMQNDNSSSSSVSSSDEEDLDAVEARIREGASGDGVGQGLGRHGGMAGAERDLLSEVGHDQKLKNKARLGKVKNEYGPRGRDRHAGTNGGEEGLANHGPAGGKRGT